MRLELSRSTIRSFRPADAAPLAVHIGTDSMARNMSALPQPYSLEHADRWIATAGSRNPQTQFALAIDDQVVGGIGLEVGDSGRPSVSEHCAEVGYWLGESYWGRGIMTEALGALTEWAFRELGLVRIHASVYARNPASARVLEKAGYACEGRMRARYRRDGEFIDGLLYAKVRLPD
ncbi:MAG: GNAT family N-acetyltransferase [Chthoniobacteraceae bacterium]